jgi:outer membrane protein assembly factor BamA
VAAGTQVGVAAVNQYGSYLGGGVGLLFSDVLNQHQVAVNVQVNGSLKDLSAGTEYINRTHRINWGAFVQRSPYVSGTFSSAIVDGPSPEYIEQTARFRQTYTSGGLITQYPFGRSARVEFNASASHIGFDNELVTLRYSLDSGRLIGRDTEDLPSASGINIASTALAFVRDTSVGGATGPILGQRVRIEAAPTFGDLRMTNVTADVRQYVMPVRPVTLAGRVLHVARYGGSSEDERLTPFYLGAPGLVRGYGLDSFRQGECTATAVSTCPQFDQLVGSRLLVFNGEVRAPLFGLFKGRLAYGPLPLELFGFADAGVAWTRTEKPAFRDGPREWIRSVGAGLRLNAFGYAVLEFALAKPLDRGRGWMFVFNLQPGF